MHSQHRIAVPSKSKTFLFGFDVVAVDEVLHASTTLRNSSRDVGLNTPVHTAPFGTAIPAKASKKQLNLHISVSIRRKKCSASPGVAKTRQSGSLSPAILFALHVGSGHSYVS